MLLEASCTSRTRSSGARTATPTTPAGSASRPTPFPCPAAGCAFVAEFMTAAHLILVWEERDDPNLLRHAERAKQVGRNPRVVSYERVVRAERLVLRVGGGRPARCTASAASRDRTASARAPPWTLGIEEELFLVDAATLDVGAGFSRVVGEPAERAQARGLRVPRRARPRRSCPTPTRRSPSCAALRGEIARRAVAHGLRVYAAGSHALARGADQPIVPLERYEQLAAAPRPADLRASSSAGCTSTSRCPTRRPACAPSRRSCPGCRRCSRSRRTRRSPRARTTGRRSERAERLLRAADRRHAAGPAQLGRLDGGDAGDETPSPLGRVAAARVRDARGARDGHADRRAPVGRARRDRPGARRGGRRRRPPTTVRSRALRAAPRRRRRGGAGPGRGRGAGRARRPGSPARRQLAELVLDGRPEAERQLEVAAADGIAAVPRGRGRADASLRARWLSRRRRSRSAASAASGA